MRKPDADGVRNPEGNGVDAGSGCGERSGAGNDTLRQRKIKCVRQAGVDEGGVFIREAAQKQRDSVREFAPEWEEGTAKVGQGWGSREKTRPMRRGDLARRPGRCGVGTSREGQGEAEGPAGIGRRPGTRIPGKRPAEIEEDTSANPPILDDAAEIEENSASISPIPFDFGRLSKNRRNNFLYFVRKGRFRQIRRKIFVYSRARKISAVSRAHETAFIPMSTVPRLFPGGRSAGTPTKTNRPGACPDRPSKTNREPVPTGLPEQAGLEPVQAGLRHSTINVPASSRGTASGRR